MKKDREGILKDIENKDFWLEPEEAINYGLADEIIDKKTSLLEAFQIVDEVLKSGVKGVSEIITVPGLINVDFADVKTIMKNAGSALFGVGKAQGEGRSEIAARAAINSPLLDLSIKGAKGILFNVSGEKDISLAEIDQIAKLITQEASPDAKIIFGAIQDEKLKDGEIKVTVIAAGF